MFALLRPAAATFMAAIYPVWVGVREPNGTPECRHRMSAPASLPSATLPGTNENSP